MLTALQFSHQLAQEILLPTDFVVDGTMGNGHDTLFLAQSVPKGHVWAFDVQAAALTNTRLRLTEAGCLERVTLIQDGHQQAALYLPDHIKLALFNLGYLPRSDKTITTQANTTIQALNALLPRLLVGGRILLVVYYGHEGGEAEKEAVTAFAAALPQEAYSVATYQFLNQRNAPPVLLCIEKK